MSFEPLVPPSRCSGDAVMHEARQLIPMVPTTLSPPNLDLECNSSACHRCRVMLGHENRRSLYSHASSQTQRGHFSPVKTCIPELEERENSEFRFLEGSSGSFR